MNLFIAKLNPGTTSQDLQKLFAHYGFVTSVKVIIDHYTGRSKGYGFIEMPNMEEATEAVKELDSSAFQDAIITVKYSQPSNTRLNESTNQFHTNQTTGIWSQHEYIRDTTTNPKFLQGQNSRRNFGYRGNGNRKYDQY
jgi:RNA recognition motif-containing protein